MRASRLFFTVVLLVTAGLLSACRLDQVDTTLPGEKMVYCTFIGDPPIKDGGKIDGPGRYRCDGDGASSITFTVRLEQKHGTSWTTVTSRTWVIKGINTTRERTEKTRTRTVQIGCAEHVYRTAVHVVEHSRGLTKTFDYHSVGVTNPCEKYRSA
jgi:hypothetical protein